MAKVKDIKGSRSSALAAITDGYVDFRTMVWNNRVYDDRRASKFLDVLQRRVSWDPATYAGESCDVGVLWSVRHQDACILPAKADDPQRNAAATATKTHP